MSEAASKSVEAETNVKETIESILIAFILAFIFRTFVVEAFVIPTGSMAPTLMGAHLRYRCEDCGYEFTVNFGMREKDLNIPGRSNELIVASRQDAQGKYHEVIVPGNKIYHLVCPNCGYRVQASNPIDPDNSATNPPVHYGDRILVLKYLYLLQHPKRWDVVVFKSPEDPDYQINYIKRLIGRPGETIMLLDGDVYTAKNVPNVDPKLEDFVVQTKPRYAQDVLWRPVYDNDYYPSNTAAGRNDGGEALWQQPWTRQVGQNGWQPLAGRIFNFDNTSGNADIFFDPEVNSEKHALTDWLAYDVTYDQGPTDPPNSYSRPVYNHVELNDVSDVRLSFFYQRQAGDGALRASVSKIDHTFIAELTPGRATLLQRVNGQETILGTAALPADTKTPTRVDLINCDYQVTLRINDHDLIKTTPDQYHPDIQFLFNAFNERRQLGKPSIRISAASQKCSISHLSLWRDVYYQDRKFGGEDLPHATPSRFPRTLMHLSENPPEYFCCGDNSPISGDGRYWSTPINLKTHEDLEVDAGKVPQRFLLGRAFFVYWPAGFKPVDSAPALVPDFGDMRFIH